MAADIDELQIKIAADSQSASENVLALAGSLESLANSAAAAAEPLKNFSQALNSLKSFKIGSGFSKSIEQLSTALPKFISASDSFSILVSSENLEQATARFQNIADNIKSLKINTSFEKNLDQLSAAMKHLNEIGDTSAFAGGVAAITSALNQLNNIEVGQGFLNLVKASQQWEDSLYRFNGFKLNNNLESTITEISNAAKKLNEVDFSGFKKMSDAFSSLPKEVKVDFSDSIADAKKLTSSVENLNKKLNETIKKADGLIKSSSEVKKSSEIFSGLGNLGKNIQMNGVIDAAKTFDRAKDAFGKISGTAFKALGTEVKAVMSPLTEIGRKFKEATVKAGQFLSSVKRIAMYRAIRSILKAITEGFEEGRKSLYYYSQAIGTDFAPSMDKAATAALYLKNSIGAATAPLTNYLVPMIDKAVDHIVELINKFNELTAVLTKQSTWTKAVKYPTTWQDSLEDAEKSAKKLKSTMLGFDELNVIEPTDTAVKAKEMTAEDYSKMFEEVQTDMKANSKIPELLMPIKLAWDSQGDKVLKHIKGTWESISGLIQSVKRDFKTVWMSGFGTETIEIILQIFQNISGTVGAIASGIQLAWDNAQTGLHIIGNIWGISNNLLAVYNNIWKSIRGMFETVDFSPLIDSFETLTESIYKITDPSSGAAQLLQKTFDNIIIPIGKWFIESGLPYGIEAVSRALDTLGTVFDNLNANDGLEKAFDKLKEVSRLTFDNIKGLAESIGKTIASVLESDSFMELFSNSLFIVDSLVKTVGEIAGGIKEAWDENSNGTRIFQSLVDTGNNVLTVFREIGDSISDWASDLDFSPLLSALGDLGEAFERLTDPNNALAKLAKSVFDKVLEPIGKLLIEQGLPATVDLLAAAFDGMGVVLEFLEPLMQVVLDFLGKISTFTFSNIAGLAEGFKAIIDVAQGKDVSNRIAELVQNVNDENVDTYGGKDSWYSKFNKKMQDIGSHGMYDFFTIDLPKSGEMWSEILHGTEDQKGIFGQIGDALKDIWNEEYENAFGNADVEIISEYSMAKFDTNVKDIQTGYKKIGDSASDVYSKTQSTEPAKGLSGAFEKLKTEYQDFSDVWGSGVTSMSNGWNGFVDGIQTKWQTFKDDWASGMTGISTAATGTWDSVKSFFSDGWESIKAGASDTWENVKTFFSDGWESIKGGADTFGENWSTGWQSMKDSVSDMWDNAKSDFESGWYSIMDGVDNFKKSFSTSFSTIKKTVKDTWGSVTSTLSSKWDDFNGFVSDYRSNWQSGFEEIKSSVSDSWENIKSKIGDSFAWQSLKQNVADYSGEWFDKFSQIKGNVSDTSQKIYNDLSEWIGNIKNDIENSGIEKAVSDIKDSIVESVGKIWGDDSSGIKGTFKQIADGLSTFISDLFDENHLGKIGDQLKNTLNSVIDVFETAVNWIIKGLNFFVENVNDALDIHIDIPNWVPGIGGSQFTGFSLPEIPEFSFYKFDKGGFPDKGSLFMANEVGNPELVGKIGNQTAVVNNQQIVKAVSEGVFNAVVSAMSKTSSSGDSEKNEIHIYLDRREITAQVEQQQRDNGVSIMSGLVYT